MREARFVEMAEVVKFMTELRVFKPALLIHPIVTGTIRVHCAKGVEIAVRFLCGGNVLDEVFEFRSDGGVGFDAQAKRRAFDGFVNIRVVEGIFCRWFILKISFTSGATAHGFGGEIEVKHALGRFALAECERHGDGVVGGLAVRKQSAGEPDLCEWDGLHGIIRGGPQIERNEAKESGSDGSHL